MDVKGSEWTDEQIMVYGVVHVEGVWCYHGYKTINMVLAFITAISYVYVSNSKLNIYPVC